jgi:NADPH:quinone reductase-like Zn-dependent oxidoreductase
MSSEDPQMSRMSSRALWITGEHTCEIKSAPLNACVDNPVLIRTLWTGISRGTERLVHEGKVPPSEGERMRAPFQEGDFSFPLKYGYSLVGEVERGPLGLLGRNVFALHPHQDRVVLSTNDVIPLPPDVPPRRAVLAPSMETALNAVWDAGTLVGQSVAVVGAGIIGVLIAHLVRSIAGCEVTLIDVDVLKCPIAQAMGLTLLTPETLLQQHTLAYDTVFHTSGTSEGLNLALNIAGFESTVVEVSWYGDNAVQVNLGGAFHSQRLTLISSQVGHVSPSMRPRWNHRKRLEKALRLLCDERLDSLVATSVSFEDMPEKMREILTSPSTPYPPVVSYGGSE